MIFWRILIVPFATDSIDKLVQFRQYLSLDLTQNFLRFILCQNSFYSIIIEETGVGVLHRGISNRLDKTKPQILREQALLVESGN